MNEEVVTKEMSKKLKLKEVELKLSEKEQQLHDYENTLKRLQADFENYIKRTEKEKQELIKFANGTLLLTLLPTLDDFERALENKENTEEFVQGVMMIYEQLNKMLDKQGLNRIETKDHPLDPNLHDVIKKEGEGDTIIKEVQSGYLFHDKVLRPAKVIIGGNKND